MDFLKAALDALPSAATSQAAFVAYIVAILGYVYIQNRIARNKQLLSNLEKLPARDRLKALELEMGSVRVPAESLVTFRLGRSLEVGVPDEGYSRNGRHYHRY